jgi:integrase
MPHKMLTALAVTKLKPPISRTTRVESYCASVRGFGVRVTHEGSKSWIFVYTSPTKRKRRRYTIGNVDLKNPDGQFSLDLEQARSRANDLRRMVREGRDPADERETAKTAVITAAQEAEALTFRAVVERYNTRALSKLKRGWEQKQIIERELVPYWGERAIGAITAIDVQERVEALIDAEKPGAARALFDATRRIFNWAASRPAYRLEQSPVAKLRPTTLIGKREPRRRVLDDDEIRALWRSTDRLGYPFGPLLRVLMLSALRLREASDARWSEVDLEAKLWIIDAARMKGGVAHAVPLTPEFEAVFHDLPRFGGDDDFVFTSRAGRSVTGFGSAKERVDRLMLEELRAIATARGKDPAKVKLAAWRFHDIRRTVRTRLSRLKIPEEAREAVLAHVRPGIKKTYDVHDYLDEKREALTQWSSSLRAIVEPPPANVVALRA